MLCLQVLSRAALAVHDCERLPEFSRSLDCSVAGPQVRTRPRQLDVATMHGYPGSRVVTGHQQMSQGCHQSVISSPVSRDGAGSHIYMEVDPLYSTFAPC